MLRPQWFGRPLHNAVLIVPAVFALIAAGMMGARSRTSHGGVPAAAPGGTMAVLTRVDQDIALWEGAAKLDPFSAYFLSHSAALYMQRARLTGDVSDAQRAEDHARASLALRTQHNGGTFVTLAASLLEQHRFEDARNIAQQLVIGQPDVEMYHSLLGETQLELGDYDGARASFAAARTPAASSGMLASAARWAELQGDLREARRLLRMGRAKIALQPEVPKEETAWFDMRDGDLALQMGQATAAEAAYRRGLALAPTDYRLLAAMSRLSAARGREDEAISYGEASIATVLDPGTLGVIADAYTARGDTARASEYDRTMEVALSGQPGAYHRAWSLYMLDHGRRVNEIVDRAGVELKTRRDVYGYDIVAWALYKANRHAEAQSAMAAALRLGTRDPLLLYHAGTIAYGAGDEDGARGYLSAALELDPVSRPRYAAAARSTLDRIDAGRDRQRAFPERVIAQSRRVIHRSLVALTRG